jgi:hypothetical protein
MKDQREEIAGVIQHFLVLPASNVLFDWTRLTWRREITGSVAQISQMIFTLLCNAG